MANGRTPVPQELQALATAQRTAANWCHGIVTRLDPVGRFVVGGGDPRLYPAHVPRALQLFETNFKSRSPGDIRTIRDAYEMLRKFLASRVSYVIESNTEVDHTIEGDTYAYVVLPDPTIHVAERFFGEGAPLVRSATAHSQITVGPRILNDAQKVRVLIHESAHARLGAGHAGGVFGFDVEACATGLPNIRSFEQASNNAYCYDHFAFCLMRQP
jgi:hypothetical protein